MPLSLGIDIGGTNIKGILVDGRGCRVARRRWKSASMGRSHREILDGLAAALSDFLAGRKSAPDRAAGIGVASAGLILKGRITCSPNLEHWEGLDLGRGLSRRLGRPVHVENDVNALAYGEWRLGAGRGTRNLVVLALGTGVGGGLILDGKLYRGGRGLAAELGHMSIDLNGRPCPCGSRGCLEAYAGATAIGRSAELALARKVRGSAALARLLGTAAPEPAALAAAARKGNRLAVSLLAEAGAAVGVAAANLVNALDPDLILLAGGVSRAGRFILEPARREARRRIMNPAVQQHRICLRALGDDGAALGAALLARESSA